MSDVGLMLVGAVLFVNGLVFLGRAEGRGSALINIFVGSIQTVAPFWVLTGASGPDDILAAAPVFLFGLTYLWSGVNSLTGHSTTGMGWFCFWVAGVTVVFSLIDFLRFGNTNQGMIWLNWGALWATFGLVLALGRDRLTTPAGWMSIIMSVWTCTVPALLSMIGVWSSAPGWIGLAATIGTAVLVPALSRMSRQARFVPRPAPQPAPA